MILCIVSYGLAPEGRDTDWGRSVEQNIRTEGNEVTMMEKIA